MAPISPVGVGTRRSPETACTPWRRWPAQTRNAPTCRRADLAINRVTPDTGRAPADICWRWPSLTNCDSGTRQPDNRRRSVLDTSSSSVASRHSATPARPSQARSHHAPCGTPAHRGDCGDGLRNLSSGRCQAEVRNVRCLRRAGGSDSAQTRPRRTATAAASARALTPSLAKRLATWVCTVRVPMKSASPISRSDRPSTSRRSTSSSRVSPPGTPRSSAVEGARGASASAMTRRAATTASSAERERPASQAVVKAGGSKLDCSSTNTWAPRT